MKIAEPFGSAIAIEGPISPEIGHVDQSLKTVAELMQILAQHPPRQWGTIQSAANAWARYREKPLTEIPITDFYDEQIRKGFRPFLAKGKSPHAENTIRTYVDHIRFLSKRGKEISLEQETRPSPAWQAVLKLAKANRCLDVALHFQKLKEPNRITVDETDALMKKFVDDGAMYNSTKSKITCFWRLLRDLRLNGQTPDFLDERPNYGIRFKKLPIDIKENLVTLLAWLTADWAKDRPAKKHLRPETVRGIRITVCMLFGFVLKKFPAMTIKIVSALFTESIITDYVDYAVNQRGVDKHSLRKRLEAFGSAVRAYTKTTHEDHAWFKPLMGTLPAKPDQDKIDARKKRTRVDHRHLRRIPGKIRAAREKSIRRGTLDYALSVRDEFIIMWLLYLPWRQRNIRLMRTGGLMPNLFKGPLADVYEIPAWVIEELNNNPEAEFWQIRFIKEETKMKHGVVAVLPRPLIAILEEYLSVREKILEFNGAIDPETLVFNAAVDPETLLLNAKAKTIGQTSMTDIVQTLTFRHLDPAKPINPHRFRDLFAYAWLKDNPKDFLTLSKILWHKSVQVTIDTYGAQFDVASGVFATEAWAAAWDK